jgi:DDE family transposase
VKKTLPPAPQVSASHNPLALRHARGLLEVHLQRLRELPAHGNTKLSGDQLVLGLLLSFFDPMARSLRQIEGCGDFRGNLDLQRMARSTTSDAMTAFDPRLLVPLIQDLKARCPGLGRDDPDLATIARRIVAADGTYLTVAADVAWALHHTKTNGRTQGQVRANVQLDVDTWVPQVVSVSGDDGDSEPAAFAKDLLCGVLYVVDRNFLDFNAFVAPLLANHNDLVLRVRANAPATRVLQSLPLTAQDLEAGVVADERVELTGRDAPRETFRLVTIQTTNRQGKPETIRLLTNLTDRNTVAARVIGAVYRLRWQIELFFKWLKCFARMDHLLSASRAGITTQLYVAVIAVLLMHVQTGRRVSIYALAALSRVAAGTQSLTQAMEFLARRQRERELDRARQARRRQRKKLA